jgi:hypothetical protein
MVSGIKREHPRGLRIALRISDAEAGMLQEMVDATGLSVSDIIRQLIRERASKLEVRKAKR